MSRTIRIDEDVYEALQAEAVPFQDTPNSVLRRLMSLPSLDSEAGEDGESEVVAKAAPGASARSKHGTARSERTRKRKRAPKGSLLPESEYELPILQIIHDAGGSAPASEVVDDLGRALDEKLQELDRETLSSGRIRWESRAQFVRLKLREKGDLMSDSPRGIWAISQQGQQRLESSR